MGFDKSKVFTALNAEELNVGTRVLVADTLDELKHKVSAYENKQEIAEPATIIGIHAECMCNRFRVKFDEIDREYEYALAYVIPCMERPFNDLSELITFWDRYLQKEKRPPFTLPFIWVVNKVTGEHSLITGFRKEGNSVWVNDGWYSLDFMYKVYNFEDGRPFGVVIK